MKWFYNLKITKKLMLSIILVAIISGVVGIVGIISLQSVTNNATSMYVYNTKPLPELTTIVDRYQKIRVNLRDIALSKNTTTINTDINGITQYNNDIQDSLNKYTQTTNNNTIRTELNSLKGYINNDLIPYENNIFNLYQSNQQVKIQQLIASRGSQITNEMEKSLSNLNNLNVTLAKQKADSDAAEANKAIITMIIVVVIGILIAVLLGVFISRLISKQVNMMVEAGEKISQGDLDITIDIDSKDEIGILAAAFKKMIAAIKELVADTDSLTKAALEGNLQVRANSDQHAGDYKKIVDGINNTLDAILAPINEAMQVMDKMAVNDFTTIMGDGYKGMLEKFADSINEVQGHILTAQDVAVRISEGDLSRLGELKAIGRRCENDRLVPAFALAMETIQQLINEVESMAAACINGDLNIRGNQDKYKGGYKEIIGGFNHTLEAVVKPIREASDVLQKMAEGDLNVYMTGDYQGDYARIKVDLNTTLDAFNNVLTDINNAAQQVASGANQIAASSQALSQGSTEQASSIEELTASVEEISSQTKKNAENANQGNELAQNVKSNAEQGNAQMKEMLKAMEEINESSASISKIIKVIDEIAFQTNILALNAAVEAARAGQHGKGFAVVAEEVRNLAARSANAAKETTELIEGSIKKVEGGTKIAKDTAEALNKIVGGIDKVATLVNDIDVASNEQATGITQINQGIMQVAQVVQSNSASSEEGAASSEELSGQAELLKEMVGKFNLKENVKTYKKNAELTPEVLKMLDRLEKNNKINFIEAAHKEAAASKPKIELSAQEFGKY